MHVRSRNFHAAEFHVERGNGIMYDRCLVAKIDRCPRDGVDTHVAHCSRDNHFFYAVSVQNILETGVTKGIDLMFQDEVLPFFIEHLRSDRRTFGTRDKKRRVALWRFMANVNDEMPGSTC